MLVDSLMFWLLYTKNGLSISILHEAKWAPDTATETSLPLPGAFSRYTE
jgi:hypothetical protein